MQGVVIRSTGKWYKVKNEDGSIVDCRLKGKIRLQGLETTNPIAVGDVVYYEKNVEDGYIIYEIEERRNFIVRQSPRKKNFKHIIASNLDQAFLIVTMAKPRTSTGFIDRFLITAEAYHIPTVLIFNKQDVFNDKELKKQEEVVSIYRNAGYKCYLVSSETGQGIEEVRCLLKDKITLFCGHSGVGKSTFANAIDEKLNLKTGEISQKHLKGMHTTTFAEMLELSFGGNIIDIPGIKEFGVLDFEKEEVCHYFPEMRDLIHECKFHNCLHINEPKCGVQNALENDVISLERYKNYCNILFDVMETKPY